MASTEESLQSEINARLRPWLDLAALVPFDIRVQQLPLAEPSLVERVFLEGCAPVRRESDDPESSLMHVTGLARELQIFPSGVFDSPPQSADLDVDFALSGGRHPLYPPGRFEAARIFYALFYNVRWALERIVSEGESLRQRTESGKQVAYWTSFTTPFFGFSQSVSVDPEGLITFEDHPSWAEFKMALRGVRADRLRHCPECRRIYYAVRRNKMACDAHLALAAVKRSQKKNAANSAAYEFNRKVNRLVKQEGLSIGEAQKQARNKLRDPKR